MIAAAPDKDHAKALTDNRTGIPDPSVIERYSSNCPIRFIPPSATNGATNAGIRTSSRDSPRNNPEICSRPVPLANILAESTVRLAVSAPAAMTE